MIPPKSEPLIKLEPIIKLIGKFTVSAIKRLTLLLFKLFCIPIISMMNKDELKIIIKNKFLRKNSI